MSVDNDVWLSLIAWQRDVYDFHAKYDQAHPSCPQALSPELALSRVRYLIEEVSELAAAFSNKDQIEVVDALVDIIYFAFGTAVCMGVNLAPFWDEIHRSNMTKGGVEPDGKITKGPKYCPPNLREVWTAMGYGGIPQSKE